MSLRSILAALRTVPSRPRTRAAGRRAGFRPRVEPLDDRIVPSFSPAAGYAAGSNPQAVVTADFNGDGKLDVATADPWPGAASVLLGRGDGTLTRPVDHAAGSSPTAIAVGDFDGDGRPDLAAANAGSGDVSVLLNDGVWPALDAPSLRIDDVTVTEGHTGTVNATFTVTLSVAYDQEVRVDYATGSEYGTATAGTDYQAGTGTVVFAPGQTTATITVPIYGDRLGEGDESFRVELGNPTPNASFADGWGSNWGYCKIVDDEPIIGVNSVTLKEGNSGVTYYTFTVSLSPAYDQPVTVRYATQAGSAKAGSDYQAASGTLTFAAGEATKTVTVAVYGDTTKESDEYFHLVLSDPSGNALIGNGWAWGWIQNDDEIANNGKGRKK